MFDSIQALTEIRSNVNRRAYDLQSLAAKIHRHPELGFEERQACAWQTSLLRKWGFRVRSPFGGLDTAYRAEAGKGKPAFCIMAEYDALPELGHGCGHNLIAAAALGAGVALAETLRKTKSPGTVVVMGTPGEEGRGGKIVMLRHGALKGIDAVMLAHPSSKTAPDMGCTAVQRFEVAFHGKSSHAAGAPEKGRNALDAVMLLFQGVNAWRQQLPESSRVHGIVREGGAAPNIIPDFASCRFYLRSPDDKALRAMARRFHDIARGAALMTGTRLVIEPYLTPYKARRPNAALNEAYLEAAKAAGLNPVVPKNPGRGSSDFGDVSQVAPGAHVHFSIGDGELPGHSVAFREAAASAHGARQMLRAAEALAVVGHRYLTDAELRRQVAKDFK